MTDEAFEKEWRGKLRSPTGRELARVVLRKHWLTEDRKRRLWQMLTEAEIVSGEGG